MMDKFTYTQAENSQFNRINGSNTPIQHRLYGLIQLNRISNNLLHQFIKIGLINAGTVFIRDKVEIDGLIIKLIHLPLIQCLYGISTG